MVQDSRMSFQARIMHTSWTFVSRNQTVKVARLREDPVHKKAMSACRAIVILPRVAYTNNSERKASAGICVGLQRQGFEQLAQRASEKSRRR